MSFLGKFFAPIYVGMANGRFIQKQYNDAIFLYKKACRLDQSLIQNEHICSCVGRSYLALGKYDDALEELSRSYSLYNKIERKLEGIQKEEFLNMLDAYAIALMHTGQKEKAEKIRENQM